MSDKGFRYKNLSQALNYTGVSADVLKNMIKFGHLKFVNSGRGPVSQPRSRGYRFLSLHCEEIGAVLAEVSEPGKVSL